MTYAQHAYKPIKRLGAVSFSIASILYIHLSIHILLYECVHLICIRHTSSLKLFVDAHVEVPEKKHHKTKTSQKLQTSNDMDSLCKLIDSRSFTFLCADRGIRIWHSSLVVRWVAWPKKLHTVALPRFGLHWPYDSLAWPKKLHMVALPRFGLHWPYDSPKGVFCFRGGWVGETKQSCATCATIARFPPTLLTRDVKRKMSIHHLRLTCIVSLVNRYYTWHVTLTSGNITGVVVSVCSTSFFWKTSTEIACTCKTQTDTCIPHSNT